MLCGSERKRPAVRSGDHDFDPPVLAARMVQGVIEDDPVRLHGAIQATLQIHPSLTTDIFDQARRAAAVGHGGGCVAAIDRAIDFHLAGRPIAQVRHCPHCDAHTVQERLPMRTRSMTWRCSVCGRRADLWEPTPLPRQQRKTESP